MSIGRADDLLVLPALVEPHAHLDKAFTAHLVPNPEGTLGGAVDGWMAWRASVDASSLRARVRRAVLRYLANGTTAIRTHVDTGPDLGLRAIEAVLDVRRELGHLLDIQVVAAAGLPVTGDAGAPARSLVREAIAAGADLVGGAPWLDDDPGAAIDALLDVAAWSGTGVDLHLDETTDLAADTLSVLAERVLGGFPGAVTASHVVSLGQRPAAERRRIAGRVAEAGISVVVNPITNLYLQGRGSDIAPRGLTAVRELLDAGVALAAGGDNLQDPFEPMGRADPLETASLLVTAGHLDPDAALRAVTVDARRVLGLPSGGAALVAGRTPAPARDAGSTPAGEPWPGAAGDALVIRASSLVDAIGTASWDRIVVHGGRIVARRTTHTVIDGVEA